MQNLGTSIRAEWAEVGRTPDPPTYEAELAGGGKETHEHNETTLVTDEDRAAWEKHLAEAEAFQRELMDRSMKTLFIRGVQTPPLEDGSEWMLEQAFMGSRVPINKLERRYFYVRTEIINSPAEGKRLMEAITALSGISREAMRAATETFPGEVEESNGDTSGETGPGGG